MLVGYTQNMKNIDKRALDKYGISGLILMEHAAEAIYRFIESKSFKKIAVVCGTGNNGGDGFALSRLLAVNGYEIRAVLVGKKEKISGDCQVNYNILCNMGIAVEDVSNLKEIVRECDAVVDGILGTGFKGELRNGYDKIVECINNNGKYIISIDIPSGINADNGHSGAHYIKADSTITFGCLKYGLLLGNGRVAAGNVIVNNISLPRECIELEDLMCSTCDEVYPMNILRKREIHTNKGDYGKVAVIAGSKLMSGAASLASEAAIRTGSGLVTCIIPKDIVERVGSVVREAVLEVVSSTDGIINMNDDEIKKVSSKYNAIAIGPGLSRASHTPDMIKKIISEFKGPMVLDADALNALSEKKEYLSILRENIVLTPHPGEMSRLTGIDIDYIVKNPVEVAREFAARYKCIVLLKGATTVVTDGVKAYLNTSGNPGMATGGSGDVLTGIIVSLIGQGYTPCESSCVGCYIHGRAGDIAEKEYSWGLKAGDIIKYLGKAIDM